ncbi:MAG TPA: 23S rRNA (guanosine(2251)-2'-O)-methyltransferase RlmB [Terriglobia bacterium]|nr:23S rRNA (guanosine(2251)-2'-O)-methyltransferase RlmB [Terriglobia bacterium]
MSKRSFSSPQQTLYGINTVREAIGRRPIEYVLVAEGPRGSRIEEIIHACHAQGIPLRFAPRQALDRMAGAAHHQNVLAVCSAKGYEDLESVIESAERPLLVALDSVEDPANLGSIVRTAVAAGAHGAIIPERRAAGISPTVARVASGAIEHLRIARVTNLTRALMELKKREIWVYGFEAQAEKSYLALDYSLPCALVLGGEGHGLRRLVRETCDELARIPLYGPVESLNVSVAAAIVLYEAARQRSARRVGSEITRNA